MPGTTVSDGNGDGAAMSTFRKRDQNMRDIKTAQYRSSLDPQRRIFRGPTPGHGRRGSFERHMLEGLFLKAYCLSAFRDHQKHHGRSSELRSPTVDEPLENGIVRRILTPRWKGGVPREYLEVMGEKSKAKLFEDFIPVPAAKLEEAADVMGRLKWLSPRSVDAFAMKTGSRNALVFRLLFPRQRSDESKKTERVVEGYYALSYRWQNHAEAPNPRVTNCKKYEVGIPPEKFIASPVSDAMLEAIMEELPEGREGDYGLWCDQVCIDESNDEERNTAVGMMDSIYRAAAKVIIALDDVEIAVEEIDALIDFSAWHDYHTRNGRIPEDEDLYYMRDKPRLRSCVEKIIYSEYFDRAWCAHEFELAVDRIVLVRTQQMDSRGRLKVVRIEDDKLHSLMLLLTLLDKQVLNPAQASRRVNVELLASRADRDDPEVHSQFVHDMQTLALVVSMKAGGDPTLPVDRRPYSAVRDKMSIMLNASDMALVPSASLAIDELPIKLAYARIYEYISLLMLAAGNPLILTTSSLPIPATTTQESWLRKFWLLDAGIDASLPRLPRPLPVRVDPEPGCRWIEMDLLFPAGSEGGLLHTASDKFVRHATNFVADFRANQPLVIENDTDISISNTSATDLESSALVSRREYITHLIACILECRWTWGYGPIPAGATTPSPSTTSPNSSFGIMNMSSRRTTRPNFKKPKLRMKYSSEKPWQYFFGEDLDRIPESISWTRKDKGEQEQKTAKAMAGELMGGLLLTAPVPETRGDAAVWRPAWFEVSGEKDGESVRTRYIAMIPRDGGTYRASIPDVLKDSAYKSLARCWVLEERNEGDSSGLESDGKQKEWIVRNRSKIVMETDTLEQECDDELWVKKENQRVWGRTRGEAEGDDDE